MTAWAGQRMIASLRARMFDHVNRMSLADYDRWRPGEFMSRFSIFAWYVPGNNISFGFVGCSS